MRRKPSPVLASMVYLNTHHGQDFSFIDFIGTKYYSSITGLLVGFFISLGGSLVFWKSMVFLSTEIISSISCGCSGVTGDRSAMKVGERDIRGGHCFSSLKCLLIL